jgi:hypothetical protein
LAVAVTGTIGAVLFLLGLFTFLVMGITEWTGKSLYSPGPMGLTRDGIIIAIWGINCGGALCVASILWFKGRWKSALAIIIGCIAVAQLLGATGIIRN